MSIKRHYVNVHASYFLKMEVVLNCTYRWVLMKPFSCDYIHNELQSLTPYCLIQPYYHTQTPEITIHCWKEVEMLSVEEWLYLSNHNYLRISLFCWHLHFRFRDKCLWRCYLMMAMRAVELHGTFVKMQRTFQQVIIIWLCLE